MKKQENVFLREEKEKIKSLDGSAKVRYIWDYYKLWIIGIAFAVFFVIYMGRLILTGVSDHWFYLMIVNTNKDVGNHSELWQEYADYTGYDQNEKTIEFNAASYFDYLDGSHARNNKYYETFVAYTEAGTLDAVVMDAEALKELGSSGRLLDLNSEACSSIAEKYGDRFIYCEPYDESYGEDLVAVGIDLSDSSLMTEYGIYTEGSSCALAIGAYSENLEAVELFLDMVTGEEE